MAKFIKASDILKEKGYEPPKFNTDAFFGAVGTFFRSNEATARLALLPASVTPENGFTVGEVDNGFGLRAMEDVKRVLTSAGLPLPKDCYDTIYVDRSFLKNAAAMLTIMCGFVVEKSKINGKGGYIVSLV